MSDTEQTQNTEQPTQQVSQPDSAQGQQSANTEATFTQADLDSIGAKARKEGRASAEKSILETLGIDSLDSLKGLIDSHRQREEAELSEIEKLQKQINAANKKADDERKARETLQQEIIANGRKQAFVTAVQESGGTNASRVYALLQVETPDALSTVFGEGATPDEAKMKALIKQVQADYAEYFGNAGAGSTSNANGIAPNSQNTDELEKMTRKFKNL